MGLEFTFKLNGILQQVPAITTFTGNPNQILGTNVSGLLDSSLWTPEPINRLTDVDTSTNPPISSNPLALTDRDILRWDGTNYVPSRDRRSQVWTVHSTNVGGGVQQAYRFRGVPSTDARFRSPYAAVMTAAVSSTQDTDDVNILIFVDGTLTATLNHPLNTDTQPHTPNLLLTSTNQVYVQFSRVGSGNVSNITFEMHLLEVL